MLLFVAGLGALAAQAPPDAAPQAFRAEVNFVTVDVAAVDRFGEPITTLTADDFTVEEDGAAQTIQSFKFVSADGEPAPGSDLSLPIRLLEHGATEAARDEVRVFVLFWDDIPHQPWRRHHQRPQDARHAGVNGVRPRRSGCADGSAPAG